MIDREREQLKPVCKLVNYLPLGASGRKINPSTVWRWATIGVRGIKLETTSIGGTLYTSIEAFHRFCDALDRARGTPTKPQSPTTAGERAARELEAAWGN